MGRRRGGMSGSSTVGSNGDQVTPSVPMFEGEVKLADPNIGPTSTPGPSTMRKRKVNGANNFPYSQTAPVLKSPPPARPMAKIEGTLAQPLCRFERELNDEPVVVSELEKKTSVITNIQVGELVFAIWRDKTYYSGVIKRKGTFDTWVVEFDDGTDYNVSEVHIIPIQVLGVGVKGVYFPDERFDAKSAEVLGQKFGVDPDTGNQTIKYAIDVAGESKPIWSSRRQLAINWQDAMMLRREHKLSTALKGKGSDITTDNVQQHARRPKNDVKPLDSSPDKRHATKCIKPSNVDDVESATTKLVETPIKTTPVLVKTEMTETCVEETSLGDQGGLNDLKIKVISPGIKEKPKEIAAEGQYENIEKNPLPSSSKIKEQKRPMKKSRAVDQPQVPMEDSQVSNNGSSAVKLESVKVEKKLSKHLKGLTIGRSNNGRKKRTAKNKFLKYSEDEKRLLYADGRFVLAVNDVHKDPADVFIWRIVESERCLRQFYPSKYGNKQFFISSPVKWYFFEEEFKGDEFYSGFVPIVVIVANECQVAIRSLKKNMFDTQSTVQFVYMGKPFFNKMLRCIPRIPKTEHLRPHFINSMQVLCLLVLEPALLKDFKHGGIRGKRAVPEKVQNLIRSLEIVKRFVRQVFSDALPKCKLTDEIIKTLTDCPTILSTECTMKKRAICLACLPKKSIANRMVSFSTHSDVDKPYDKETFLEVETQKGQVKTMYLCEACGKKAVKLQRLEHFLYHLMKLIKQNSVDDIKLFRKTNSAVSDNLLLWVQRTDFNWKNVMFLDFQMVVADVEAEFETG